MSEEIVIGARVRFYDGENAGTGIIREVQKSGALAIEVDGWADTDKGHDCSGTVQSGGGWWVDTENVTVIAPPHRDRLMDWGDWGDWE